MGVGPIDGASGADRLEGPRRIRRSDPVPPAASAAAPADRVEISDQARLLNELRQVPEIRSERVEELRRAIEAHQFETDERLRGAIDRFLSDESGLPA
jgi:hypothetical protein